MFVLVFDFLLTSSSLVPKMDGDKDNSLPFSHINERLSIPCTKCEDYVDIKDLHKHRELHRVLKIFRCTFETKPKTLKQLLKKRRQIINDAMTKANSDNPIPAKIMQKIDWAFEILKNQITNEELGTRGHNQEGLKKTLEVCGKSDKLENIGLSFGICQCQNDNWRTENEDRFTYKEGKICETDYFFCGLFDGYNGVAAADKCSEYFEKFLIEEIVLGDDDNRVNSKDVITAEKRVERENFIKQAIKKSFSKMDKHLLHGESETSKHRWSGASATICYIENETLYVGNVGDVRALYVKSDGNAISLGEDHILRNKKERERVKKSNGSISIGTKSALVNGLLSSTRGLGNHGDPNLKSSVICKPKIDVVRIDQADQFLILFTAGIWDVFNDEEVMFLLEDIMPDTSGIDNLRQHFNSLASNANEMESLFHSNEFMNDKKDRFESFVEEALNKTTEESNGTVLASKKLSKERSARVVETLEERTGDKKATKKTTVSYRITEEKLKQKMPVGEKLTEDIIAEETEETTETAEDKVANNKLVGARDEQKSNITVEFNEVWIKRDATIYKESKACFLARALVERLAYAALLAGSRENITATVILFGGCPVNLYLLPRVKRKSVVQKEWKKNY